MAVTFTPRPIQSATSLKLAGWALGTGENLAIALNGAISIAPEPGTLTRLAIGGFAITPRGKRSSFTALGIGTHQGQIKGTSSS
ncbi:MAG: hypothetical protein IID38_05090 [Planctomycetes bacterium]|nr:hypothetical protein [Planctomycetota bacterium]